MAADNAGNVETISDAEVQRQAHRIGANIQRILQNVSSMQRMAAQIGTQQDTPAFQRQFQSSMHFTAQLCRETSSSLSSLSSSLSPSSSSSRRWRLQRERLQDDFARALKSFQDAQRLAANKERQAVVKARSEAGRNRALLDMDTEENEEEDTEEMRQQRVLVQEEEARTEQMEERERSIRQLESDIVDVNTLFKDLATLVHDQGDMVDTIEANVETTHISVEEGTQQLAQALVYKNKVRRKRVCLAVCLLVVLVIIGAVLFFEFQSDFKKK